MGFEAVAYIIIAAGTAYSVDQSEKARSDRNKAADAQKDAQKEQKAANAAQAAQERRQQIRDERIRRARILQAGENTGTEESSGEFGAIGSLATQLGTNLGFNLGQLSSANRRSDLLQTGADFLSSASSHDINSGYGRQFASIGQSIFSYPKPTKTEPTYQGQQLATYPSPFGNP